MNMCRHEGARADLVIWLASLICAAVGQFSSCGNPFNLNSSWLRASKQFIQERWCFVNTVEFVS